MTPLFAPIVVICGTSCEIQKDLEDEDLKIAAWFDKPLDFAGILEALKRLP